MVACLGLLLLSLLALFTYCLYGDILGGDEQTEWGAKKMLMHTLFYSSKEERDYERCTESPIGKHLVVAPEQIFVAAPETGNRHQGSLEMMMHSASKRKLSKQSQSMSVASVPNNGVGGKKMSQVAPISTFGNNTRTKISAASTTVPQESRLSPSWLIPAKVWAFFIPPASDARTPQQLEDEYLRKECGWGR